MVLQTRLHLNRGERVIWRRRMTLRSLWLFWLLGLATIWLYGIGLLFIVYAALKWVRVRYLMTSQRVIKAVDHYAFLLRVETISVPLSDITRVEISQSPMGSLLGYGEVTIRGDGAAVVLSGLRNPGEVRERLRPYL